MKVIIPPVHERLKDGADPAELDVFGRKKFADNLTNLFKNTSDGLVLTVNSNWGDGKTSFIKLWEKELEADPQFIPIYYDAFSNDFTDDAFLSIAVEIHRSFEKEVENASGDPKTDEQLKCLKEQTINIVTGLLKMLTRMAVSSLSGGLIPSGKAEDFVGDSVDKLLFGTLEYDTDAKFSSHLDAQKLIKGYQDQLKSMLTLDKKKPKKIVFFVDELDRCRPDFAIQVIEKIKHLFSVDGVFFVLAINKNQLMKTIQSAYGVGEKDSEIYLQKFVHLETILPPLEHQEGTQKDANKTLIRFVDGLIVQHGILDVFGGNKLATADIVRMAIRYQPNLNPRGYERVFTLIAIALGSSPTTFQNNLKALKSLCLMSFVKVIAVSDDYNNWKNGKFRKGFGSDSEKSFVEIVELFFDKNEIAIERPLKLVINEIPKICAILDIYSFPQQLRKSYSLNYSIAE